MNDNLIKEYQNINTPNQLLEFMNNYIEYGYLGKNGKVYYLDDKDFDKDWFDQYILQDTNDILKTRIGNCWDLTEFARAWFLNHAYEIRTIFQMVNLDYNNLYPTHSYLLYKNKDNNKWNWFEFSDYNNRGIHQFDSLKEAINAQFKKYNDLLETYNITQNEKQNIIKTYFNQPKIHISAKEYISFCIKQKD